MKNNNWKSTCLILVLVGFTALIAYTNIVQNQFLFDDVSTIERNKMIRDWRNIPVLFSKGYFKRAGIGDYTYSGEGSYRPLVTLSYFIDYMSWGNDPRGFHLTNLLLHVLNFLLFFMMIRTFVRSRIISFFAGVMYAVHPVLSEAVNCTSFREDILCSLFFWCGLWIHRSKIRARPLLVSLCALLSMFSKEMGITFFPVLILLDLATFYTENEKINIPEYILLLLTTVFYGMIRFYVMKNPNETGLIYPGNSFLLNIATMAPIFVYYVKLLFYPMHLTVDYDIKFPDSFFSPKSFLSVLALMTLTCISLIICIRRVKQRREITLACVSVIAFFITLMPVSNIIPIKNIIAERYLYLPFGFFALLSAQILTFPLKKFRKISLITFLLYIILCVLLTLNRNENWANGLNLWTQTLRVNKKSFHAHNNLADWYSKNNMLEKAANHYRMAIKVRPYDPIPYFNLANTLKSLNDLNGALFFYEEAIKRDPSITEPYVNMGIIYAKLNKLDLSVSAFLKAIAINYNDSPAHNNLGVVFSMQGKLDAAIKEHSIAIRLDASNENAYMNLALCYMDKQEFLRAVPVLERMIRVNPSNPSGYYHLGICWEMLKKPLKAQHCYQWVLKLQPDHQGALEKLRALTYQ